MKYNDLIIIWTLGYYFQHNEDEKINTISIPFSFLNQSSELSVIHKRNTVVKKVYTYGFFKAT